MSEIFISYSSHDRQEALTLCKQLNTAGYQTWIDHTEIDGATNWSKEIVTAISGCKIVAVLLSPDSITSKNVIKEISLAAEKDKQILPIEIKRTHLSPDLEYYLTGLHRVKIENEESILKAVKRLLDQPEKQDDGLSSKLSLGKLRVAVLPFDDLSPANDIGWLADSLMDELINMLSADDRLHVNPRTDVLFYKGKNPRLDRLTADLKCKYIIVGGVQRSEMSVRIHIALSDAKKHMQLWSGKYDGTLANIFDLQDKICNAVLMALKYVLLLDEDTPDKNTSLSELRKSEKYYGFPARSNFEEMMGLFWEQK